MGIHKWRTTGTAEKTCLYCSIRKAGHAYPGSTLQRYTYYRQDGSIVLEHLVNDCQPQLRGLA